MTKTLIVDFQQFTTNETLVDTTKRINDIYYQSKCGLIPAVYCFNIEHKEEIEGILKQMKSAMEKYNSDKYKTQLFMRKEFGV